MSRRSDFHTHTIYGDGKNTPKEMAQAAYTMGMTDFGISEHAWMPDFPDENGFGLTEEKLVRYTREMRELQEWYRGRMKVHFGIELDGMGPIQKADYTIGSTHMLRKSGRLIAVDDSEETLKEAVQQLWQGDWYAMAADYYKQEEKIVELTSCHIIGHFDLITKFNQGGRLFDESADAYREVALDAMKKLNRYGIPFEINTGAISRGYRKEPYPSSFLLKELRNMGGKIMINSDSHSISGLDQGWELARQLAADCGFSSRYILDGTGGYRRVGL